MSPATGSQKPGPEADYLRQLISEDWRERQSAITALVESPQKGWLSQILEMIRQDHMHLNVLSSALQVLEQAGQPVTRELVEMLNGPDQELRTYVPIVLGSLGGPEVVRPLVQAALDNAQPENVRFNAIEALGKLKRAEAVEPLRAILRTGSLFLKYGAIAALGNIGQPEAARDLLPFLADEYLAEPAIGALGLIGDALSPGGAAEITGWLEQPHASPALAISALAALARRSPDPNQVRAGFLNRLSEAGAQKLLIFLKEDPLSYDKASEAVAFNPFTPDLALVCGWLVESGGGKDASITPDGSATADVSAAGWLAALRKSAGAAMVELLASEPACHTADSALQGHQALVLPELIAAVSRGNPDLSRGALRLLVDYLKPERTLEAGQHAIILPALLDALESNDETLAALAAEGLGKTGNLDPEALWQRLDHPSARVRGAVVSALLDLRPPDLAQRALALLHQAEPVLRTAALHLLAGSQDTQSPGAVLDALGDPSPAVRRAAVELIPKTLALLPEPALFARIEPLFADPDPAIRRAAVQAAELLPPETVRPVLLRAAGDENGRVRAAAIRELARHPHPESIAVLLQHSGDPLPPVRLAVVEGLARLAGLPLEKEQQAAVRQGLVELGKDADEQVRGAASAVSF